MFDTKEKITAITRSAAKYGVEVHPAARPALELASQLPRPMGSVSLFSPEVIDNLHILRPLHAIVKDKKISVINNFESMEWIGSSKTLTIVRYSDMCDQDILTMAMADLLMSLNRLVDSSVGLGSLYYICRSIPEELHHLMTGRPKTTVKDIADACSVRARSVRYQVEIIQRNLKPQDPIVDTLR